MNSTIHSIIKGSLTEVDEHLALAIFYPHCPLRCEYCYNKAVVENLDSHNLEIEDVHDLLIHDEYGLIDAISLTGGEPALHQRHIKDLLRSLKQFVRLDEFWMYTSGAIPIEKEVLELLTCVAITIKPTFAYNNWETPAGNIVKAKLQNVDLKIILTVTEENWRDVYESCASALSGTGLDVWINPAIMYDDADHIGEFTPISYESLQELESQIMRLGLSYRYSTSTIAVRNAIERSRQCLV